MRDPRVVKIADVVVNYSTAIKAGERVIISGPAGGAPLVRELYRRALRNGAFVATHIDLPGLSKIFFDEANEEQLRFIPPWLHTLSEYDVFISLWAADNTKEGTNFDADKRAIFGQAMQPFQAQLMTRSATGDMRWCGVLYPTPAHAQDADMSVEDYEDFVFGACLPDPDDPIGFWQRMAARQDKLVQFMNDVRTVRLVALDTDLTVQVGGRKWINCSGQRNFPDGEVFTSPLETKTEGCVRFTYPAIYEGSAVEDVRLWFEKGRVVKATAAKGEAFLNRLLDRDEGARRLGEFAIGTNPGITRFTGHALFDEKIQGTAHMALGFSIPEAGGVNQSQIHWDMVCDLRNGGKIYADDRLIYADGEFLIDFE